METEENNSIEPPELNVFSGDWDPYEEALYAIFIKTLVKGNLTFLGMPVRMQRRPELKGKHFTFWHLTSEGEREDDRVPDLRRCERLHWISWVIENVNVTPDISFWESKRKGSRNYVLWHEPTLYAVVLAKRSTYYLLKTAYIVKSRRAKGFRIEREQYRKQNKA